MRLHEGIGSWQQRFVWWEMETNLFCFDEEGGNLGETCSAEARDGRIERRLKLARRFSRAAGSGDLGLRMGRVRVEGWAIAGPAWACVGK